MNEEKIIFLTLAEVADMKIISDAEVEKRIKAWANVTLLSLDLKRAMLRKQYPEYSDDEIRHLMVKELSVAEDSYK